MVNGPTIIIGAAATLVVLGIIIYAVMIYNGLVRLRRNVDEAWSNIDVLLKQRSDELPKLIDTVQQYMDYEHEVLQKVTEARTEVQKASSPKEEAQADGMLKDALGDLFAVAEDYPDLKANESFQQLQDRISTIEEQISDRREFYNDAVNQFNIRINQIPYVFIANTMSYQEQELFEVDEEDRQDVDIGSSFGQ